MSRWVNRSVRATLAMIAAGIALGMSEAQATIFTFSDEYYVSTLAEFRTLFGSATTGYTSTGVYQLISPGNVVNLGSSRATAGEFTAGTTTSGISVSGWQSSALIPNGGAVGYVISNPSTTLSFQYKTGITNSSLSGGTVTAFNLNSINLSTIQSGIATGYYVEGLLGGTVVDSLLVQTNGNEDATNGGPYVNSPIVTFNWTDIDTVQFCASNGTTCTPWPNGGTLDMTNINISPYTAPALPEPASLALLGLGLAGLGFGARRKAA